MPGICEEPLAPLGPRQFGDHVYSYAASFFAESSAQQVREFMEEDGCEVKIVASDPIDFPFMQWRQRDGSLSETFCLYDIYFWHREAKRYDIRLDSGQVITCVHRPQKREGDT